jgi:hypothetical protein
VRMVCLIDQFWFTCFYRNAYRGTLIDRMSGIRIAATTPTAAIVIVHVAEAMDHSQRKVILIAIEHNS